MRGIDVTEIHLLSDCRIKNDGS